jgi:tRNA A-37 threonylcarbamoyl transferase component Bud32
VDFHPNTQVYASESTMTSHENSTFNPQMLLLIPSPPDAEEFTFNYVLSYNNKVFDILLCHKTISGYDTTDSIESEYLRRLEESGCCDGDDPDDIQQMLEDADIVEREVEDAVIDACQSTIQELAPDIKDHPSSVSLHSYMYPDIINLQLVTLKGTLKAVECSGLPKRDLHPPATDKKFFDLGVPHYQASDVTVLAELYASVVKVSVNGQILCGKLTRMSGHDSIYGEVRALHEIHEANFDSSVKVPRLRGIITSHTGVVGFLMDYIPSRGQSLADILANVREEGRAECKDDDGNKTPVYAVTKMQKEKWSHQIEHTLKALHSKNIIWGDAKTSNVLIDDISDDAWIVDFGGGNTYGWVDRELHGMAEGDLQALEKIKIALDED